MSISDHLKANAIRYYEAIVYPGDPEAFDPKNPEPRMNLNAEIARIEKKYNGGGLRW